MDDLLVAQVDDHDAAADGAAALELGHERLGLLVVEVDPLPDVRELEDLVDVVALAGLDELQHQLVVGDPEVAEAPQPGAAVHQEVEQHPPGGASTSSSEYWAESAWSTARISSGETSGNRSAPP